MIRHSPLRWLLAALVLAAAPWANAQSVTKTLADDEKIPPSGLQATTIGDQVLLFQDGTWRKPPPTPGASTLAITDHGRTVALTEKADPEKDGEVSREWHYTSPSGGMIQIVISRIITSRSQYNNRDHCIPVIAARNLTNITLFRLIAELEFEAEGLRQPSVSVMLGPLTSGEESEKVTSPLYVPECEHLTARLHVSYCAFTNGLGCGELVAASRYGSIPLEKAAAESR